MSDSINPSDSRPVFTKFPMLSDDSETEKQKAIPTPTVSVKVVFAHGGAATVKRVSK
jgi:hypothetical protein